MWFTIPLGFTRSTAKFANRFRSGSLSDDRREAAAEDALDALLPELDEERSDADAAVDQGQDAFGNPQEAHDARLLRVEPASVAERRDDGPHRRAERDLPAVELLEERPIQLLLSRALRRDPTFIRLQDREQDRED